MVLDKNKIFRTTKCFSPKTNGYPGGFPIGFLQWVFDLGYNGNKRIYLCSGMVKDDTAVKIDINPDVKPDYVCDATNVPLPNECADWIMIDPPYSKELAKSLYNTEKYFYSINKFTKEAYRLCEVGGLILTLSYEVPKRIKNCNLIACCGIYQTISVAHMRCFTIWRKIS